MQDVKEIIKEKGRGEGERKATGRFEYAERKNKCFSYFKSNKSSGKRNRFNLDQRAGRFPIKARLF